MKRTLRILLSLSFALILTCMVGALAGCSDQASENAEDTPEEVFNTAVIYYSATGNTQRVADMIAGPNNGVLFPITPSTPYTEADLDGEDPDSRFSRELENGATSVELVSTTMPDWESYDTVFLGYPIWLGEAAFPMQSFVAANDFSGKKVIPFCTSEASGIGTSAEQLAEIAKTGEWLPGGDFSEEPSLEEVSAWVSSLGLGSNVQA